MHKQIWFGFFILVLSCDIIKPASKQLILERENSFIKNQHHFDRCMNREKYLVHFKAKFEKNKTGFSELFNDNTKLIVKNSNLIQFMDKSLVIKEKNCLKKAIQELQLNVRDSRLSHENLEISLLRNISVFEVKIVETKLEGE